MQQTIDAIVPANDAPARMVTTLYELIAAIQDAAAPGNDAEVVATVWHVLQAGRATWHAD